MVVYLKQMYIGKTFVDVRFVVLFFNIVFLYSIKCRVIVELQWRLTKPLIFPIKKLRVGGDVRQNKKRDLCFNTTCYIVLFSEST